MAGSFNSAFAAARKAGKKEFTWNGKSYNTRTKDEDNALAAGGPKRRPSAEGPTKAPLTPRARPTATTMVKTAGIASPMTPPRADAPKTETKAVNPRDVRNAINTTPRPLSDRALAAEKRRSERAKRTERLKRSRGM